MKKKRKTISSPLNKSWRRKKQSSNLSKQKKTQSLRANNITLAKSLNDARVTIQTLKKEKTEYMAKEMEYRIQLRSFKSQVDDTLKYKNALESVYELLSKSMTVVSSICSVDLPNPADYNRSIVRQPKSSAQNTQLRDKEESLMSDICQTTADLEQASTLLESINGSMEYGGDSLLSEKAYTPPKDTFGDKLCFSVGGRSPCSDDGEQTLIASGPDSPLVQFSSDCFEDAFGKRSTSPSYSQKVTREGNSVRKSRSTPKDLSLSRDRPSDNKSRDVSDLPLSESLPCDESRDVFDLSLSESLPRDESMISLDNFRRAQSSGTVKADRLISSDASKTSIPIRNTKRTAVKPCTWPFANEKSSESSHIGSFNCSESSLDESAFAEIILRRYVDDKVTVDKPSNNIASMCEREQSTVKDESAVGTSRNEVNNNMKSNSKSCGRNAQLKSSPRKGSESSKLMLANPVDSEDCSAEDGTKRRMLASLSPRVHLQRLSMEDCRRLSNGCSPKPHKSKRSKSDDGFELTLKQPQEDLCMGTKRLRRRSVKRCYKESLKGKMRNVCGVAMLIEPDADKKRKKVVKTDGLE